MSQIALLDFQAARYLMKGEVPGQAGNDHPTSMPTSAYRTKDGYMNLAVTGDPIWKRFCKSIAREDLLDNPLFKGQAERSKNRVALNAELAKVLAARNSADWIERLNRDGVPCGPIYTIDQVFADPQVQHLGAATKVRHPRLGEYRIVNQAVKLSRTPASIPVAPPEMGEHTEEVLKELGYTAADIETLREKKIV
jgi:formyl-CoA transferase